MSAANPLVLTNATRFPPAHLRRHSRSPSRSPQRKSQFLARELDPLLNNLSPDSTLKALQSTTTIGEEGNEQSLLSKSIAEASPAEREIGIRAAVAAQKVKEWHREILQWSWPGRRDRAWGAGFLPPGKDVLSKSTDHETDFVGFLTPARADEYQERIEDIRDGVEALDLEDVKDHVFSAHVSQPASVTQSPESTPGAKGSIEYGRMKDFTALITATIVQALPELANLSILLDTWDARLSILRQIPAIAQSFDAAQAGVKAAFAIVRSPEKGPLVTIQEYELAKSILGNKVSALGAKIDHLLDLLEGQEDTLPKNWIDTLEDVESEYATWVVEAEHVAFRNNKRSQALATQPRFDAVKASQDVVAIPADKTESQPQLSTGATLMMNRDADEVSVSTPIAELPGKDLSKTISGRRMSRKGSDLATKLQISTNPTKSTHNRGVSEVSVADSMLSAISDFSNAEIADARTTKVLASPKISIIDNPFRSSRDELSWFTTPGAGTKPEGRPPMLQRASTASMEVIPKDTIKQVMLKKSRSYDMLHSLPHIPSRPSTPTKALEQLTGIESDRFSPIRDNERATSESTVRSNMHVPPVVLLPVAPLELDQDEAEITDEAPGLPRKSSKRVSQSLLIDTVAASPFPASELAENPTVHGDTIVTPVRSTHEEPRETLEDKIKDILEAMPNKFRLTKDADDEASSHTTSATSTRSSTPIPTLTLSPAKADRLNRQAAPGDVRVFHLSRSGQSRDAPPVKLFVRAVGENGERVMVRVGGGWADLAEYLREYSLHHGHRGLSHGKLEVASYPSVQTTSKEVSNPGDILTTSGPLMTDMSSTPLSDQRRSLPGSIGADDLPSLVIGKVRKNGRSRPTEGRNSGIVEDDRPPVPPIPATYTMQSPTTVTTTVDGVTTTDTVQPLISTFHTGPFVSTSPTTVSGAPNGQVMATETSTLLSGTNTKYTPLGAAGPASNGRRAVTYNASSDATNEAWVEGMVGKARAVSGGTTIIHGPTTTTTTTVISKSSPRTRKVSGMAKVSPVASSGSASPVGSGTDGSPSSAKPKGRKSLGDVSGIRRVFLRRKSDK